MNQAVADIIKEHIEGLDFVDKIAGLTSVLTFELNDKDNNKVIKSFPIACCVTADDCKEGAYNELMPDSAYKTVIYFEDGEMTFTKYEGRYKYYSSTLRLVCWINVAKILSDTCKTGTTCTLSSHLITEIIRALPRFPEDHTPFHQMYHEVTDQVVRDNSIFSKYTFDEKHVQYLMYPYDYFALTIKTDFAICLESDVVPAPCADVIDQMTPVADEATGVGYYEFTAHWEEETEAVGYYLDVATDAAFTTMVTGYDGLDVGNILEYEVTGLDSFTTYYYRIRCYDDTAESDNSNTITVITDAFDDWFLPSRALLTQMYNNLHALGIGGFTDAVYHSSYESAANVSTTINFATGLPFASLKNEDHLVRACRVFTDTDGVYSLGDTGPAGGYICYITGTTVYEASHEDDEGYGAWSNITNVLIGTTVDSIAESQNNTNEIIAQAGHTTSAASYCDELET